MSEIRLKYLIEAINRLPAPEQEGEIKKIPIFREMCMLKEKDEFTAENLRIIIFEAKKIRSRSIILAGMGTNRSVRLV